MNAMLRRKRYHLLPWILLVVPFLVRLLYVIETVKSPYFDYPIIDEAYHINWARALAVGDWLGVDAFFRAPLYPYLLGVMVALFGENYFRLRLLHVLIGTVNCGLLYGIAKRTKGKTAALISLAIASFYWTFVYYDAQLLIVSTFVFWILLSLYLLFEALEKPTMARWFLCGISMGLAAITRPNFLLFVPAAVFFISFFFRKERAAPRAVFLVCFLTGVLAPPSIVTVRNYIVSNDVVCIASQGGINFYIGNNRDADGWSSTVPGLGSTWQLSEIERIAVHDTGEEMKPSEVSRYWLKKGLEFIADDPVSAAKLYLKKMLLFWNHRELKNNVDLNYSRRYSFVTRYNPVGFFLVAPLAISGIFLSWPWKRRDIVLILFVLAYMVSVVLFFVCARYRLPVVPVLVVYAGYALARLSALARSRDYSTVVKAALVIALSALFVNLDFYSDVKGNYAQEHYNTGTTFFKKGEYTRAVEELKKAVRLHREYADAYNNLGYIYEMRGNYGMAEEMYRKAISSKPEFLLARGNLANVYLKTKRRARAIELFRETLPFIPAHLPGYAAYVTRMIGIWYYEEGEYNRAYEYLHRSRGIDPSSPETSSYLARTKEALEKR
jgi:4-amino-4-deoxy-L-arabinose transferase-like glycosyltransferase